MNAEFKTNKGEPNIGPPLVNLLIYIFNDSHFFSKAISLIGERASIFGT